MRNKAFVLLFVLTAAICFAADTVLVWPTDGQPQLKFTIGKLNQIKAYSGQADYVANATVANVGSKPVPFASFYVYLLDKKGNRVGEGYIEVSNVAPGQEVKVPMTAHAMGNIASMQLQPQHLPSDEPVKVTMQITSVPAGASLKVDGQDAGLTPATLRLVPGKHDLEFSKEGYAPGTTPLEIAAGSPPGTVNFVLSSLAQDTVVLRDGTVVMGDVTSVNMTSVTVRLKGKLRSFNRNQVARLIFVERKPAVPKARSTVAKKKKR
jgi:hypothetical protein